MSTYYLIGLQGRRWFELALDQTYKLGSDPASADLVIEDESVAALHVSISEKDGTWQLEDLDSGAGTFLNKEEVQSGFQMTLALGDRLSLGFRDFVLSDRMPLQAINEQQVLLSSSQLPQARWNALDWPARSLFLIRRLAELLDLRLAQADFLEQFSNLLRESFAPDALVFALKDNVHVDGIKADDPFTESLLNQARFQTKPLAFRAANEPEAQEFYAFYAPVLLHDLAQGYCYLIADPAKAWSSQAFDLFAALIRYASVGLTALADLERAKEDREVLHLNLVGVSPTMQRLKTELLQIATQDTPVMVYGEPGVGKSRIARAVHQASARRHAPLMVLNAGNFPKELFESEICGVETEESNDGEVVTRHRPGKVEMADGGTLLIEEIGEVPLGVQPTLLTLIRSGQCAPVGGDVRQYQVRVIATSSTPLSELLSSQRLIPELAQAFQHHYLEVPALRQRRDDIPQLFRAFLARFGEEEGLPTAVVTDEALSLLQSHPWPLNIRELRDVVAHCFYDLHPEHPVVDAALIRQVLEDKHEQGDGPSELERQVMATEHRLIQEALMASNDDVTAAAKSLGISLVVLRRKMRQLAIG